MVGNIRNYTQIDIMRVFLRITEKPKSRQALLKETALGEGTMRSILDKLKEKSLLISNKQGHSLSTKGKSAMKNLLQSISYPEKISLPFYNNYKKIGIKVNLKKSIKPYILRDIAVKNGAEGALIFTYKNKKLFLPDAKKDVKVTELEKKYKFKEDDIIIVAFTKDYRWAENAALAAAMALAKVQL